MMNTPFCRILPLLFIVPSLFAQEPTDGITVEKLLQAVGDVDKVRFLNDPTLDSDRDGWSNDQAKTGRLWICYYSNSKSTKRSTRISGRSPRAGWKWNNY